MAIFFYRDKAQTSSIEEYLGQTPSQHSQKVFEKLRQLQSIGMGKQVPNLKLLKPKIWKYSGKIYKLRVDAANISSRILFCWNSSGELILLHGFRKTTQKTPKGDGKLTIRLYQSYLVGTGQTHPIPATTTPGNG